ncbi:MAG TPA: FAD-binding oxidoreductase [Polyangiaceae bacterium]
MNPAPPLQSQHQTRAEIFAPASVEEGVDWVRRRIDERRPFWVAGRQTRSQPAGHLVLSTHRLDRIRWFEPDDMVIGVEAGARVADVQKQLGERNMLLPVNPWYQGSSVGGVVACNEYGPDRLERGGLRDFIIGIEYINGEGRLVKAGGKVVKNVTGYDLGKMMLGSRGGLGVITAVHFKVIPARTEPQELFVTGGRSAPMSEVRALHEKKLPVDWLELVCHEQTWSLGVGFSGNQARRERIRRELGSIWGNALRSDCPAPRPGSGRLTGFLTALLSSGVGFPGALHVHGAYPTRTFCERVALEAVGMDGLVVHPIGGDFHAFIKPDQRVRLNQLFRREPGFLTFLDTDGERVSPVPSEHVLMRELKNRLDPYQIFVSPFYDLS